MFDAEVQWHEIRLGRYTLEIPDVMVREAHEHVCAHVAIRELPRPPDPDGIDALWAARLAEIRAEHAEQNEQAEPETAAEGPQAPPAGPGAQPAAPARAAVIEESEPMLGLRQVIHFSSPYNPERVRLVALLDPRTAALEVTAKHFQSDPDVVVLLELDGFVDITAAMTRMVSQVAAAYRTPRPAGAPTPAPPRFHLAHGSLALTYQRREHAQAEYTYHAEDDASANLTIVDRASGEDPTTGLIDSVQAFIAAVRGELDLHSLGDGSRKVAGVRGQESRVRNDTPGERGFLFAYKHLENDAHPELSLRWVSRGHDLAATTTVWDRILGSVRRIG